MARIETPLSGNTASLMRRLYRICCKFRADCVLLLESESDVQNAKRQKIEDPESRYASSFSQMVSNDAEATVALCNTIIVITGLYFGQGEEFAKLSSS
jgi:hypothetical protein